MYIYIFQRHAAVTRLIPYGFFLIFLTSSARADTASKSRARMHDLLCKEHGCSLAEDCVQFQHCHTDLAQDDRKIGRFQREQPVTGACPSLRKQKRPSLPTYRSNSLPPFFEPLNYLNHEFHPTSTGILISLSSTGTSATPVPY